MKYVYTILMLSLLSFTFEAQSTNFFSRARDMFQESMKTRRQWLPVAILAGVLQGTVNFFISSYQKKSASKPTVNTTPALVECPRPTEPLTNALTGTHLTTKAQGTSIVGKVKNWLNL